MSMRTMLIGLALLGISTPALAGPVVLGGDDLNDHGGRDAGNNNVDGWTYIQSALTDINNQVTRGGPFTSTIAVLGSAAEAGCPNTCSSGDAGAAVTSAAANAGLTVAFFDGPAAIQGFFTALAMGSVNPRIIYLPGTESSNDLQSDEGDVLSTNAGALQSFVASGGGLMSHGCSSDAECETAYGWLTALVPGLQVIPGVCESTGATLTAVGQAALPGVTNANIDDTAGPCHNTFAGNFGTLQALAIDGDSDAFILGGIVGGIGNVPRTAPTAGSTGMGILILALAGIGLWRAGRVIH